VFRYNHSHEAESRQEEEEPCFSSETNIGGYYVADEPTFKAGFVRWKPGYPIANEDNNCGAFDINEYILDISCYLKLPYICEILGQ
jgi:hypothetical protein